jgi:hypothetical protein
LVPVEKRNACQLWFRRIVKGGPAESDEWNEEEEENGMKLSL